MRERAGEPACGQAASIGQKATRNSAEQIEKEQIEKEGVRGRISG